MATAMDAAIDKNVIDKILILDSLRAAVSRVRIM
jgi:hypothetical protein